MLTKLNGLTKENFFNGLKEMCPISMDAFCKFIDEYKESVNWDYLFGNSNITGMEIKFHDLPPEMQIGIIDRFFQERAVNLLVDPTANTSLGEIVYNDRADKVPSQMRILFIRLEEAIKMKERMAKSLKEKNAATAI